MQGRPRSHHPRALSGLRGEKPIRGSEERELSTKISPPERQPPILLPLHTRLFGPHTKWQRVGNGHALMFMMTSLSLSSPRKPCILTILVLASEVGIDFMIIVRTVWAKDPFILNGCFCN